MRKRDIGVHEAFQELPESIDSMMVGLISKRMISKIYDRTVNLYRARAALQKGWDNKIKTYNETSWILRKILDGIDTGERDFSEVPRTATEVAELAMYLGDTSVRLADCRTGLPPLLFELASYLYTPTWQMQLDEGMRSTIMDMLLFEMKLKTKVAEALVETALKLVKSHNAYLDEGKSMLIPDLRVKVEKGALIYERWCREDLGAKEDPPCDHMRQVYDMIG